MIVHGECGLAFQVEVLEDGQMSLILDNCPRPGMTTVLTGHPDGFLLLSRVIQLKATIGLTAGRA